MNVYDLELNENSYRALQPNNILIQLKPHQLTGLYKAIEMEKKGVLTYNIKNNEIFNNSNITISTNVGIIGDIVGYGKTLLALSIIAANNLNDIHINDICIKSFNSSIVYSYFSIKYNNYILKSLNNIINSTLIIAPRGPVYLQWENTIKNNTTLKYIAIDNLKFIKNKLPKNSDEIINFFNSYDIVLIKNTTLKILIDYYGSNVKSWKRIMIDEAHDIITKISFMKYYYLWLISATYTEIPKRINNSCNNNMGYILRDYIIDDYINFILIKNEKKFIKNSFDVPISIEKYYICKSNVNISAIKTYINQSIMDKINVNDIDGAIKELGGKNDNENNIVELVCRELNRELSNKEIEKKYLEDLDIPIENKNLRLKNINNEIDIQKEKIKNLKDRITELSNKTCSICLDFYKNPIILECTHVYCGVCLINWLKVNNKCPTCRKLISPSKIISINNDKKNNEEITDNIKSKEDTFIDIILSKTNGKFLVFSKLESGFEKIRLKMDELSIKYDFLKGNTSQMVNILNKFKNGDINVILLNTQYAGSGIDINFATDVIIFHSMGLDKQQAVGRAQRVGRTEQLYIHNLCYEHEIN